MSEVIQPSAIFSESTPTVSGMPVPSLESWTDIVTAVNSQNGVAMVTMEVLRDIDGYGRLGSTVRQNIAKKLSAVGIGYMCGDDLPNEASATIILYRLGTPVANLIELVTSTVAGGKATESAARELRKYNILPDPEAIREGIMIVLNALDNTTTK